MIRTGCRFACGVFLASVLFTPARGDDGLDGVSKPMEPASEQALLQTQALLRDRKARAEAISKDPKAKKTDEQLKKLAGGSDSAVDAIYDLSADIMETITRQAGGDSEKMRELLVDALRDPAKFVGKFSPEQKAKLGAIAGQVPDPTVKKKSPP